MLSCDGSSQFENGEKHNSFTIVPPLFEVHNSEGNHHFFSQNLSDSEACRQESVSNSVEDVLQNNSHVCPNDIECCFQSEKMDNWHSGSFGIESSADLLGHFTDIELRQDMEHDDQPSCSEYNSPLNTHKYMSEGVTSTCRKSCSNSEHVARKEVSSTQIGTEGRLKRLSDEIGTQITEDVYSPIDKFDNDLDNSNSYGKGSNATTTCS